MKAVRRSGIVGFGSFLFALSSLSQHLLVYSLLGVCECFLRDPRDSTK